MAGTRRCIMTASAALSFPPERPKMCRELSRSAMGRSKCMTLRLRGTGPLDLGCRGIARLPAIAAQQSLRNDGGNRSPLFLSEASYMVDDVVHDFVHGVAHTRVNPD